MGFPNGGHSESIEASDSGGGDGQGAFGRFACPGGGGGGGWGVTTAGGGAVPSRGLVGDPLGELEGGDRRSERASPGAAIRIFTEQNDVQWTPRAQERLADIDALMRARA